MYIFNCHFLQNIVLFNIYTKLAKQVILSLSFNGFSVYRYIAFSYLTLLVGWQEEHLASKKIE